MAGVRVVIAGLVYDKAAILAAKLNVGVRYQRTDVTDDK